MFSKVYLEITDACNLSCPFCHGTKRAIAYLPYEKFCFLLERLRGKTEYLYFHLMGEPLLHPQLPQMLEAADRAGFTTMLTTNGTLLDTCGETLATSGLKKVSVSLQALESVGIDDPDEYLATVARFAYRCAETGTICVLRLWNVQNDSEKENAGMLAKLHRLFPDEWIKNRSGYKLIRAPLGEREVYLEFGKRFDWPDEASEKRYDTSGCPALSDQLGILCDGTVVPCCMDADGVIALGNLFDSSLDEILTSPRATALLAAHKNGKPCEKLCKSCGYLAAARNR